jgi:hypothetical protein
VTYRAYLAYLAPPETIHMKVDRLKRENLEPRLQHLQDAMAA